MKTIWDMESTGYNGLTMLSTTVSPIILTVESKSRSNTTFFSCSIGWLHSSYTIEVGDNCVLLEEHLKFDMLANTSCITGHLYMICGGF